MSAVIKETPQQAARRLAASALRDGYQPEALHEYQGTDGSPLYWRIRCRRDDGEKWIRPMRFDGSAYVLGEPEKPPEGGPLYRLPELLQADSALPVWIVEGEKAADALAKLGVIVTTSGGANSADAVDWSPMRGRRVIVWPDNDEPGAGYAEAVADKLRGLGCAVEVIEAAALGLPEKADAVDWLKLHPDTTAADLDALPRVAIAETEQPQGELAEDERTSQASQLVALVRESCELFHDENRDVFAESKDTGEVRRIDGRAFRDWLVAQFYQRTEKSARDQSVRESIATLNGLGRFQGEQTAISLRVAHLDGAYFIDLAEPGTSRTVKIEAGRWSIIERPPVKFTRTEAMHPLPVPKVGGSLDRLWALVNVPEVSRTLVLAWLVECLRPETPFPVLELIGEQGSAKSTTQSILRDLIDPNACNLRAAPKTAEDAFVGAGVNWLVSYENVSYLPAPMQDALCVLATGGGFAKRKLYSDADESVIQVKRPIILNGIAACITAQDLIDRSISIETPIITRRTEMTELRRQFEQAMPELVGAVCETFAQALARLPDIRLPDADQPRLIEFVRLGAAVAEVRGSTQQEFLDAFRSSREESVARTLDASPVAVALIDWWNARGKINTERPLGELFAEVSEKKPDGAENWPRSAKGFGDSLRRVAPALRQMGIECRSLGKRGGVVCWSVGGKLPNPSPESPEVLTTDPPKQDIRTIRTLRQELSPADREGLL